jgi:hypothetical protein
MAVNRNNPDLWKADIARSVDMYNAWFIQFAPEAFRSTRMQTTQKSRRHVECNPEPHRHIPDAAQSKPRSTIDPADVHLSAFGGG